MRGSRRGSTRRAWTSPARPTARSRSCAPCSAPRASGAISARIRPRRLRQHRREPAQARRPLPRSFGTRTPWSGAGSPRGGTSVAGGGRPPADPHGSAASGIVNLQWDGIGPVGKEGANARIEDLQDRAAHCLARAGSGAVDRGAAPGRREGTRVPEGLTSNRLYTFRVRIRKEAELPGLRIHDFRHTWASQGVMNDVGSPPWGGCSDTANAKPRRSCPPRRWRAEGCSRPSRGPSSHAPWDTRPARRH